MCDFGLSLYIGAALGLALGITNAVEKQNQQSAMNAAIEASYQQDIEYARALAAQKEDMQVEEDRVNTSRNEQDRREAGLSAMQENAKAEAAMSALNIAGNTAIRETGVADVTTIRREGAFDARKDSIDAQSLMNQLGIRQEFDANVHQAEANGMNAWQPIGGTVMSNILDIAGSTINGAVQGGSLYAGGVQSGFFGGGKAATGAATNSLNKTALNSVTKGVDYKVPSKNPFGSALA